MSFESKGKNVLSLPMCGSVHHTMMAILLILFIFALKLTFYVVSIRVFTSLKKKKGKAFLITVWGAKKLGDMEHKTSIMRMALKSTIHCYFRSCDF